MTEFDIIKIGDCRKILKDWASDGIRAQTCVTSPPYWGLRDYGEQNQIGLETTFEQYISKLVEIFRAVRNILSDDGTLWLNLGDCYATGAGKVGNCPGGGEQGDRWKNIAAQTQPNRMSQPGLKPKDLVGIPWRVAFALQADGWYLRSDIIWHKPNPMPESIKDRPTKSHEYIFLMSKSERYFYDYEAIKEAATEKKSGNSKRRMPKDAGRPDDHLGSGVPWQGEKRNKRTVWTVNTKPFKGAHFATFPPELIRPCILAGSKSGDIVLDPFMGSGTTALVAAQLNRKYLGCEINPDYSEIQKKRLSFLQQKLAL